jgi:hypothetical protein
MEVMTTQPTTKTPAELFTDDEHDAAASRQP